jgi:hypothetical protein
MPRDAWHVPTGPTTTMASPVLRLSPLATSILFGRDTPGSAVPSLWSSICPAGNVCEPQGGGGSVPQLISPLAPCLPGVLTLPVAVTRLPTEGLIVLPEGGPLQSLHRPCDEGWSWGVAHCPPIHQVPVIIRRVASSKRCDVCSCLHRCCLQPPAARQRATVVRARRRR